MGSEVIDASIREQRATQYARPLAVDAITGYNLTSCIDTIIETAIDGKNYATGPSGYEYQYERVFSEQLAPRVTGAVLFGTLNPRALEPALSATLTVQAEHTRDGQNSCYDLKLAYRVGTAAMYDIRYVITRSPHGTEVELDSFVGDTDNKLWPSGCTETATTYEVSDLQERLTAILACQQSERTEE